MSKKRTSTESNDEQTTKDSNGELTQAVFQNEENKSKRAKLSSLSDTTLEDLPMEVIECILVKAIAMEVKMRLIKSLWKEKVDLVISRLKTVSLKWNSILSTDYFRKELNRTLDGFGQETLRFEVVLHQPPIQSYIYNSTTMRDEVFALFIHKGYVLKVYDRNNLAVPKDVIQIPKYSMGDMAACSVSNSVYLLNVAIPGLSVIRIWKDEHQFTVSTCIKELMPPKRMSEWRSSGLSVSAQGNLIFFSQQESPTPTVVGIYDANGVVQHKISLEPNIYGFKYVHRVIQKADGNLVLDFSDNMSQAKLLEIDTNGIIIRKNQLSFGGVECFVDMYGRILVNCWGQRIKLLDSEFNLMDTAVLQPELNLRQLQYNSDRHEMVGFRWDWGTETWVFVTLRFTQQ